MAVKLSVLVFIFAIVALDVRLSAANDILSEECLVTDNGGSDCHLGLAQLRKRALVANKDEARTNEIPELGKYFVLQHSSGKCVHPTGGADNPDNGAELIFHDGCTIDRDALVMQALPLPGGDGSFVLQMRQGKCVHPSGGADHPADDTPLIYHSGCDMNRMALQLKFLDAGGDLFLLQHASGDCVHPQGGSDTPGDYTKLIYHHSCEMGRAALKFRALMVEPPTPAPTPSPTPAPTPSPTPAPTPSPTPAPTPAPQPEEESSAIYGDPHSMSFGASASA